MAFQGDLAQIPITNIVQALSLNRQEGVLSVESKSLKCKLRILKEGIRPLSTEVGKPELLRRAAVKASLMTSNEFDNALSGWDMATQFPGDFLVGRRIISEEQVENEIRRQLEETFYEIFTATDLRYTFSAGDECLDHELFDPEGLGTLFIFNVNALLMEAARREDEWRRIEHEIPCGDEIYVPIQKSLPSSLPPGSTISDNAYEELKGLIGAKKTVNRIVSESTLSKYEVFQAFFLLKSNGHIQPLPLKDKEKLAEKLRRVMKTREAIDVYRSLLLLEPQNIDYREVLLSLLEKIKRPSSILAEEYVALAELLEREDPKRAITYLEKVTRLDPSNLEAHQKLFALHVREDNKGGALTAARSSVKASRAKKKHEQGAEFLLEVLKRFPDELQLYHDAAELFADANRRQDAVRCLKAVVEVYKDRDELHKLVKTYEFLAALDPSESGRFRRIRSAYRRTQLNPRRFLRTGGIALASVVLLAAVSYFGLSEYFSRSLYADVELATRTLKDHGEFSLAKKTLHEFVDLFPLSTRRPDAMTLLREVKDAEIKWGEDARRNEEKTTNDLLTVIAKSGQLISQRKLADADRLLEVSYRRFDQEPLNTKQEEKLRRIQKLHKEIHSYLEEAADLNARAVRLARDPDVKKLEQANALLNVLLTKFPDSPAARQAKLPILIQSKPESRVRVGDRVFKTGGVIWFPPEPVNISIERGGFRTLKIPLHPLQRFHLSISLPKDERWIFETDGPIDAFPVEWQDNIYFANRNGRVFCVTPRDGSLNWMFTVPERADITGGLGAWKGVVYMGCFDGHLYLLDAASGALRKRVPCSSGVGPIKESPSAASAKGTVVVNAGGAQLVAVNLTSGSVAWRYPPAPRPGVEFLGSPQTAGGRVYLFTAAGYLLELDHDSGRRLGEHALGGELNHAGEVVNGKAFVVLSSGPVRAFDARSGKLLWEQTKLPSFPRAAPTAAVSQRAILLAADNGVLTCLDAETGEVRWQRRAGSPVFTKGVVAGRYFYVGTLRGEITCWDIREGEKIWTYRTTGADEPKPWGVVCQGMIKNGLLYQGSDDGNLYCLSVE